MKIRMILSIVVVLSLTVAFDISRSFAQTNPVFLQLGQAKGALYKPDSGPAPHVGIIVMQSHGQTWWHKVQPMQRGRSMVQT